MKTKPFCEALFHEACEETTSFYRHMLKDESLEAVRDKQWRAIIELARSLTPEQQETILAFARQATVDAVSIICGVIDGSSSANGNFLSLSLGDQDGQEHAGSLQDAFLEIANR